MNGLLTEEELNAMKLYPDKTYEIEYEVPDVELADKESLLTKLADIHESIIKSPDLQYVTSKLMNNSFFIQVKIRPEHSLATGLELWPFVAAFVVITAVSVLGLKWSVKSIKEISTPVTTITKAAVPVLLIVAAIVILPELFKLFPKRSR